MLIDALRNPVSGKAVTLAGRVTGNGRTMTPINGTTGTYGQATFTATDTTGTLTLIETARVIYT